MRFIVMVILLRLVLMLVLVDGGQEVIHSQSCAAGWLVCTNTRSTPHQW